MRMRGVRRKETSQEVAASSAREYMLVDVTALLVFGFVFPFEKRRFAVSRDFQPWEGMKQPVRQGGRHAVPSAIEVMSQVAVTAVAAKAE